MPVTAFLFPGQGSQAPEWDATWPENTQKPDPCLNGPMRRWGFPFRNSVSRAPAEALRRTENTQAAILATSVATLAVLRARGVEPDFVAGHSLGEYSALVCAGALGFEDALRLVRKRGRVHADGRPGRSRGDGRAPGNRC